MYINPAWRILTIGDGDLSFSASLFKHYQPRALTATILDDKATLMAKYGDDYYRQLTEGGCEVLSGFDVTNENTWGVLKLHCYDVVIFQFPLLPAFNSVQEFQYQCQQVSINTLNRQLLRTYLLNSFRYFLAENGAQLAFITSKEVKPYRQWNLENALTLDTSIHFIGKLHFAIEHFPGYKIRNVDRDKHVKSTQSFTYVYSTQEQTELHEKVLPRSLAETDLARYCAICHTGAFTTALDKDIHLATKKHRQMLQFEQQWLNYIQRCK